MWMGLINSLVVVESVPAIRDTKSTWFVSKNQVSHSSSSLNFSEVTRKPANPRLNLFGGFPKLWVLFGGPHNKDYNILGSILGSPYFGKLPFRIAGHLPHVESLDTFST